MGVTNCIDSLFNFSADLGWMAVKLSDLGVSAKSMLLLFARSVAPRREFRMHRPPIMQSNKGEG